MFTGLIQQVGTLISLTDRRLIVAAEFSKKDPIQIGESIAINGCCLTVVSYTKGNLEFDLSEETLRLTTLGYLPPLSAVNLERAMKASDRVGGHFVQGHVDGVGRIANIKDSEVFQIEVPLEFTPYLSPKGSIAIDGISLTIVEPKVNQFEVWIIPHTFCNTNLNTRKLGDLVNLELDVLAKHVHRMIQPGIL